MPRVQIHCYGCDATVPVATAKSAEDLNRAGWSLAHGETYCPQCAPARVPSPASSPGAGDEAPETGGESAQAGENGTEAGNGPEDPSSKGLTGAARVLARIPRPGSGREDRHRPEPRLPRGRAAATAVGGLVLSAVQLPFRGGHAPATSRSKVSSQTVVLFCIAVALTLTTLGSEHMAIRLPGVLFSFAAGLSWLRDLRRSA
jgi:hypothetical protein